MQTSTTPGTDRLADSYRSVRAFTEHLCEPLEPEDCVIQSMTDASPVRWHLAHTTWFFETFVLSRYADGYSLYDARFPFLFNSYYIQAGARFDRPRRGLLSRPTVREVMAYREHVDRAMVRLLEATPHDELASVTRIGLNHEQQHQELMLTDLKHMLAQNPLNPVYREKEFRSPQPTTLSWIEFDEGLHTIGHAGGGFSFDNESPRHRVFLEPYALGSRLVTNQEYLAFVEDGGYRNPLLWLSEGWALVESEGWTKPIYWERHDEGWREFTLAGVQPLGPAAPVCHLSFFEADAFARWSGARLPTEFEWEAAVADLELDPALGNFADDGGLHPAAGGAPDTLSQTFGDVWEWTSSSYGPYPGYAPPAGALGEYNGKFMCNQYVLRGGSCATSRSHIRATYRNFFPAYARWQFSGVRLARTTG